jgi:hypothetical protein
MGLALVATLGLCLPAGGLCPPAGAADRDAISKQVADKCRKDYPGEYTVQLGCRAMNMEAFDKIEQEDRELANCKLFGESNGGCGASRTGSRRSNSAACCRRSG